jgi:hypothetical protein
MNNTCICNIDNGGYCDRHQCYKNKHWVNLCKTNEKYFKSWEDGIGPGQTYYKLPIPDNYFNNKTNGIITGGKYFHWMCIGALAIGAYNNNIGFAIADHGLNEEQKNELLRIGTLFIEHEKVSLVNMSKYPVSPPEAWWKPWICLASPFEKTIWIDSDAVIVGNIKPLFNILDNNSFISSQEMFNTNNIKIYNKLLNYLFDQQVYDVLFHDICTINTGVVGFCKDSDIILEWIDTSLFILKDRFALENSIVRDQSSYMIMMINKLINHTLIPVILKPEYNYPADGLTCSQHKKRKGVSKIPERFLKDAIERHPKALIVHWLGNTKPWELCHPKIGIKKGSVETIEDKIIKLYPKYTDKKRTIKEVFTLLEQCKKCERYDNIKEICLDNKGCDSERVYIIKLVNRVCKRWIL